jgi:hypothetical protein
MTWSISTSKAQRQSPPELTTPRSHSTPTGRSRVHPASDNAGIASTRTNDEQKTHSVAGILLAIEESSLTLPGAVIACTTSCCCQCTGRRLHRRPLLRPPPVARAARPSAPARRRHPGEAWPRFRMSALDSSPAGCCGLCDIAVPRGRPPRSPWCQRRSKKRRRRENSRSGGTAAAAPGGCDDAIWQRSPRHFRNTPTPGIWSMGAGRNALPTV